SRSYPIRTPLEYRISFSVISSPELGPVGGALSMNFGRSTSWARNRIVVTACPRAEARALPPAVTRTTAIATAASAATIVRHASTRFVIATSPLRLVRRLYAPACIHAVDFPRYALDRPRRPSAAREIVSSELPAPPRMHRILTDSEGSCESPPRRPPP